MTSILGISAFYHDSAAALVVDGEIIAAAQENFRKKHDRVILLMQLIMLTEGKLSLNEVDHIVFLKVF